MEISEPHVGRSLPGTNRQKEMTFPDWLLCCGRLTWHALGGEDVEILLTQKEWRVLA